MEIQFKIWKIQTSFEKGNKVTYSCAVIRCTGYTLMTNINRLILHDSKSDFNDFPIKDPLHYQMCAAF